jgi:hypothetical protein
LLLYRPDYDVRDYVFQEIPMIPLHLRQLFRKASKAEAQPQSRCGAVLAWAPVKKPGQFASTGLAVLLTATACGAGVLSQSDFQKVQDLRPMFQNLMGDLLQTSRRTDISSSDYECIKATMQELMQISQELSSYEYLITIEKDLSDVDDNSAVRDVVKFAIEKSNNILTGERKRLTQVSDQCARLPLSYGKTQQAIQFIDTTTGILNSIQLHL